MTFNVTIDDSASPVIANLMSHLRSRTNLHRAMGYAAKNLVVEHARSYQDERHETADRLGAPHSNFVGQAIENLERSAMPADNDKVTIPLNHPWWARAFGDVTITPSKTYLTIPLIADAYNKRAPTVRGLFFWTNPKTGKSFLAEAITAPGVKGTIRLWYLLLKIVKQTQERERLPADEDIGKAAQAGAESYFATLIRAELQKRAAKGQA